MDDIKTTIAAVAFSLIFLLVVGFASFYAGKSAGVAECQEQLARASATWSAERNGYIKALGDAQDGVGRISAGLGNAIGLAAGATDRSIRIAILVDGIDAALRELGIIAGQ